jgi:hypothetical protein
MRAASIYFGAAVLLDEEDGIQNAHGASLPGRGGFGIVNEWREVR